MNLRVTIINRLKIYNFLSIFVMLFLHINWNYDIRALKTKQKPHHPGNFDSILSSHHSFYNMQILSGAERLYENNIIQ